MKEIKTKRFYLNDDEVSKVLEFFEKEFGITDIAQIGIDDECAVITTVIDKDSEIKDFVNAFNDFCKRQSEKSL